VTSGTAKIERHASAAGGSYSDAVAVETAAGTWVHVSGQLPVDEHGDAVAGSLGVQAHACIDRIEDALADAGASLQDVVGITVYVTELAEYSEVAAVRAGRFAGALPSSAAVQVAGLLGGAGVEIAAVAFVGRATA
jgi:2-iminobutanoate/2-iminopropanoate deaminase